MQGKRSLFRPKKVRFLSFTNGGSTNTSNITTHDDTVSSNTNIDTHAFVTSKRDRQDPTLSSLLLDYKKHLDQVAEIQETIQHVQGSEDSVVKRLWQIKTETMSLEGKCGDNQLVRHDFTYIQAEYQHAESPRLHHTLHKLHSDVNAALYRRLFEAKMARMMAQAYIDDTLWALPCRTHLSKNIDPPVSDYPSDITILENLLDALFSAERSETSTSNDSQIPDSTFLQDVRAWLTHVGGVYLRAASYHERQYLLLQLLRTSHIQWAMPLMQYSTVEQLIPALRLMFDEEKYVDGPRWSEDDYLAALDQIVIAHTYNTIVGSMTDDAQNFDPVFQFSNSLLSAIEMGIQMSFRHEYRNLTKRLAQTVCKMAQALADRHEQLQSYQPYMDDFVWQIMDSYLEIDDAWHFLPNLPYHVLSIRTLWKMMLRLLDCAAKSEPLPELLHHLPDISRFATTLADDQILGIFMLGCLSNMISSVPPNAEKAAQQDTTAASLIAVVAYALFTVAFVDDRIKDTYYKDVRDNFGSICNKHPFVISLLLRWTMDHFNKMERMALYLFRSLPLHKWHALKEDLVLLHQLLCQGNEAQIAFARYVIENLNFGYQHEKTNTSKSQPWMPQKQPFLSYDVLEELAFLLLDACQVYQPLPDADKNAHLIGTVSTAVSSYLPTSTQMFLTAATRAAYGRGDSNEGEFVAWSWRMALKLKLYDCPLSSRASDIEKSITGTFIRDMLHQPSDPIASHGSLLVYISFMLSATSRHFLGFESGDGWDKLLLVLRRGPAEAAIAMLAEIVPAFAYMHGDDFFNDPSVANFLRQMVDLKNDPMLRKAGERLLKSELDTVSGIDLVLGSHVWQGMLIDSVSNLMDASGRGFSYCDLILHSWLRTVFRKRDWMWSEPYVTLMDSLCKWVFIQGKRDMVQSLLVEEYKALQQAASVSPKLGPAGQQRTQAMRFIKSMLPDAAYASLLAGEWSLMSVTNNVFRTPGVEQTSLWFAFEVLMLETAQESSFRQQLAQAKPDKTDDLQAFVKAQQIQAQRPPEFFAAYRWLQHALACPLDHPLMPLFLQLFFSLYFANASINKERVFYVYPFFGKKQALLSKLRDHIAQLQTYHGQRQSAKDSPEDALQHETLRKTYYAMWLWLGNADLVKEGDVESKLPSHCCPERLRACRQETHEETWEENRPWNTPDRLWLDLVPRERLKQEFLDYPWVGSDKFRKAVAEPGTPSVRSIEPPRRQAVQTAPPPAFQLTKPVQVLSSEDMATSTAESLLSGLVETLHQHSERFQNHMVKQRELDEAYVDDLTSLYVDDSGTQQHIEAACGKQNQCKKPAAWDITVDCVKMDSHVRQNLETNRSEAERMIFRSVDTRIGVQALLAYRKVDAVVQESNTARRHKAMVQLAWSCLVFCLEHLTQESRVFPPSRLVVRHMSQTVGQLISGDAVYVSKFLDLCEADPYRAVLAFAAFKPHADMKHWMGTLKRVLTFKGRAQVCLLSNFDPVAWVATVNESARDAFYQIMLDAMRTVALDTPDDESLRKQQTTMVFSVMREKHEQTKLLQRLLAWVLALCEGDGRTDSQASAIAATVDIYTRSLGGKPERVNNDLETKKTTARVTRVDKEETAQLLSTLGNYMQRDLPLFSVRLSLHRLAVCLLSKLDDKAIFWAHLSSCFQPWLLVDTFALQAYCHLIRQAFLRWADAADQADLLDSVFACYHTLILPQVCESESMRRLADALQTLDWTAFALSAHHMQRIRQTYWTLKGDKRGAYLEFVWRSALIRKEAIAKEHSPYDATALAFLFCRDADQLWTDAEERKKALAVMWQAARESGQLSTDEMGRIARQYGQRQQDICPMPEWPNDLREDASLPVSIRWMSDLTGFEEKGTMERKRVYSDFILGMITNNTPQEVQSRWLLWMCQKLDATCRPDDQTVLIALLTGMTREEAWLEVLHTIVDQMDSTTWVACLFAATAVHLPTTASRAALMEHCVERYLVLASTTADWPWLARLLPAELDRSLLLQHCLDHHHLLVVRVYGQAQRMEKSADLASVTEEMAAIVSIAKPHPKCVYLAEHFSQLYGESLRIAPDRLVASIVSFARTAQRWSKEETFGADWKTFAVLLTTFLSRRLEGVLGSSPDDRALDVLMKVSSKKVKSVSKERQHLSEAVDVVKDEQQWPLERLEEAVQLFAQPLMHRPKFTP
ncbi:hypothetical protein BCR43DRAFT_498237 [Syncephalastrum racemosum]|uniref:Epg5-like TPR domain-containing protein n=1 Tax=Syncephalastrum racemosum TaxID=13706 RepID=A0A1X2H3I3_SYNRA|nr:hypothetical protein BCR43DRAFT_498237 [Syncephalastrum racemosum]